MPHIAKAAEHITIALSAFGAIASVLTQQVAYSAAPMSMALILSSINRLRFEHQPQREQGISTEQIETLVKCLSAEVENTIDKVIGDSCVSIQFACSNTEMPDNHLIVGRKVSREVLIHALQSAEYRLILVCPWLSKYAIDNILLHHLQSALDRNVEIEIGWGRLQDLESGDYRRSVYYDALPRLEQLKQQHRNLTLKPIGTHEKILVCDRKFAVIGSHNFLTSDEGSSEREVSLLTTDQNVIHQLLLQFIDAPEIALSNAL